MFCSQELASRIERAEAALVAQAARITARRVPSAFVASIGGGTAACTETGSPLNKLAGLGFADLADSDLERTERAFRERSLPVVAELATLGDPALAQRLCARGYHLVAGENVSGRSLHSPVEAPDPVCAIELVGTADLAPWAGVVATGFANPDAEGLPAHEPMDPEVIGRVIRDFAEADGVVLFRARVGGEIAGAASMRLDGGIAQLCGAATLPAFRRRGVQTALLRHRLRLARERGCEVAVVTTQPGSKSQQNAQGQGFALLYVRNVLVRERS